MSIQGVANWMGQVDPLRRTIISQTRRRLKILRPVPLQVKLTMDNGMKSAIARWIHLPNNIVPLGIPQPTLVIQSDASLGGYGIVINSVSYQGIFDRSMRGYSINVLELIAIWMATLMI